VLGGGDPGVAGGTVFEVVLAWCGEGEAHEDGDGEEGVDVYYAVEGRDVDAGGGRRYAWGGGGSTVVVLFWVGSRSVRE